MPNPGSRKTGLSSKTLFLPLLTALFSIFLETKSVFPIDFDRARRTMIEKDLKGRGIDDPSVLQAMSRVPRHRFVDPQYAPLAYADAALPIKESQTISQPYIVALMTESLRLKPTDKVLEVGTGSGYQAAVLAEIVDEVYSIEIVKPLATEAAARLKELGYDNIQVKHGDGYLGWEEHAPFDVILITAATPVIPQPLIDQLKVNGRIILPLGGERSSQDLVLLTKEKDRLRREYVTGVVFVPMTGKVRE